LGRDQDKDPPSVGVVLPAGGKGLRTGSAEPKQFLPLSPGKPMLAYAVEAFHRLAFVESIALVLPPARMADFAGLARAFPKVKLVEGGSERWESVRNGFLSLDPSLPYILVHDAARPFVSESVIRRCLAAAAPGDCVIAALPAADTIKEVEGSQVSRTLDRGRLIQVQTPQVFPRAALEKAYAMEWGGQAPTDEAMMAERAGFGVRWVRGSDVNRKVTGAADLEWAEWLAGRLESGRDIPDA
jgi:2-C-methyl-D-erythritol 4-phosphate cytidylyltransferase